MQRCTRWFLAFVLFCFVAGVGGIAGAADKDSDKKSTKEAAATANSGKGTAAKDSAKNDAASKDANIASINGTVITRAQYDAEITRFERQMAMSGQTPDPAQLADMKKMVLDGLIGREVLRQQAVKLGVKADEAEVNAQIDELKKRFPTEDDFKNTLAKMNLTEESLRAQFGQELAIKKMVDQEVGAQVKITPEETRKFYDSNPDIFKVPEMVRASHILIKVDPKAGDADKAAAKEKILAVQKRLQKGEDFAAVAKEVSDCPSAPNGGDLDYFQKGQMIGPFEDAAFALKVGSVSDIVETQFGYHIIKLTDKKEPSVMKYDDVKDRIEQHLKQEKVNQMLSQYIDKLKTQSKIEVYAAQ